MTHANHLRTQPCCAWRGVTIPRQMFAHTDETLHRTTLLKMSAMLNQNAKALLQADARGMKSYVDSGTQRLFDQVLGSKDPRIALGGTAKQHPIHTGFTDAATHRIHVFQIAVAKNQGPGILAGLNGASDRLPICVALVTLLERPAVEGNRR